MTFNVYNIIQHKKRILDIIVSVYVATITAVDSQGKEGKP